MSNSGPIVETRRDRWAKKCNACFDDCETVLHVGARHDEKLASTTSISLCRPCARLVVIKLVDFLTYDQDAKEQK